MRGRRGRGRVHPVAPFGSAHFDRPRVEEMVPRFWPCAFGKAAANVDLRLQLFGRGHVRHHCICVFEALLMPLKTGGQAEDRAALLAGHDPPVGKTAAIEIALHLEIGLKVLAPAAQEIGVERVRRAFGIDGCLGRGQRLRDHLPAEHPADPVALFAADKVVVLLWFDRQQFDQSAYQLFGRVFFVHRAAIAERWDQVKVAAAGLRRNSARTIPPNTARRSVPPIAIDTRPMLRRSRQMWSIIG